MGCVRIESRRRLLVVPGGNGVESRLEPRLRHEGGHGPHEVAGLDARIPDKRVHVRYVLEPLVILRPARHRGDLGGQEDLGPRQEDASPEPVDLVGHAADERVADRLLVCGDESEGVLCARGNVVDHQVDVHGEHVVQRHP